MLVQDVMSTGVVTARRNESVRSVVTKMLSRHCGAIPVVEDGELLKMCIRDSVMSGVNPQGCKVVTFKTPSAEELSHDFLWRVHQKAPAKGQIGIFNRSHYEDVRCV